jgi:hypothetical protein
MDARLDVAADAPVESAIDSAGSDVSDDGRPDANAEVPPAWADIHPDAGWVSLPGLPEGCVIQRATRPEEVFEAAWTACDVGIDGCTMLPPPPDEGFERRFMLGVGDHDGTGGLFAYRDLYDDRSLPIVTVIARTQGPPIAAWRMPRTSEVLCLVASVGIGRSMAAFTIETLTPRLIDRFYFAPHDSIGSLDEPNHTLTERELIGPSILQTLAVSDTTVVSDIQPSGQVAILTEDEIRIISPLELEGSPQRVMVSGRNAYWEEGSRDVRMMHATLESGPAALIDRLPGEVLSSSAHRSTLVWYEGYDQDPVTFEWGRLELWTAPSVATSGDLSPRRLASMNRRIPGRLLDGHYCTTSRIDLQHYIGFFDVEATRPRELAMPTSWVVYGGFLFIGNDEAGIGVAGPMGHTVWRIPLSSIPYVD